MALTGCGAEPAAAGSTTGLRHRMVVEGLAEPQRATLGTALPHVRLQPVLGPWRPLAGSQAAVIDPAYLADEDPGATWLSRLEAEALPVVMWTECTPRAMRSVLLAAHLRPVRLVISGIDDAVAVMRQVLSWAPRALHARMLLDALGPSMEAMPFPLKAACVRAVEAPDELFDASDLARLAHMSRRHADRLLVQSGLVSAKAVVIAARTWAAYYMLTNERRTTTETAARLAYADKKALLRHLRAVLGASAAASPSLLSPQQCCQRVVTYLSASDKASAPARQPT